jgi:CRISPR-associated exonuclease Cas4
MYEEDELLQLSGLERLAFCERQWAMVHLECAWEENVLTAEGQVLHERADEGGEEKRGEVVVCRGVALRSLKLGLSGRADVVEFHRAGDGVRLEGREGWWRPFPVEYKRGRPKSGECDRVQLCAQGMCLEEMLGVRVAGGALYYGSTRRRQEVEFGEELRGRVEELSARMHELYRKGETPGPVYGAWCERCSLVEVCLPRALERPRSVRAYVEKALEEQG